MNRIETGLLLKMAAHTYLDGTLMKGSPVRVTSHEKVEIDTLLFQVVI